jgi:sec-independent protein translocase protein TatC
VSVQTSSLLFLGTLLVAAAVACARVGLISAVALRTQRRFAIVFIYIFAAIAEPPDVFSQVEAAIPLIFLYELAIMLCGMSEG